MCQYRSYVFGACRHQKIVLFGFCHKAGAINREPEAGAPPQLGESSPLAESSQAGAARGSGSHDVPEASGSGSGDPGDSGSPRSRSTILEEYSSGGGDSNSRATLHGSDDGSVSRYGRADHYSGKGKGRAVDPDDIAPGNTDPPYVHRTSPLPRLPVPPPPPPSYSSTPRRHTYTRRSSSFSFSSPVPPSLASIRESVLETASLEEHPETSTPPATPQTPAHDMATLASVGLKHWLPGGAPSPAQMASPVTAAIAEDARGEMSRSISKQARSMYARRDGLRAQTDESSNLPDRHDTHGDSDLPPPADAVHSGELLQHIAESCQGDFDALHIGTDGQRQPSHLGEPPHRTSRDQPARASEAYENIDALEADVDAMKEDITKMRADVQARRPMESSVPIWPAKQDPVRSPRTRIPAPAAGPPESAAARLKKAHEEAARQAKLVPPKTVSARPPPSPFDFPDLSQQSSQRRKSGTSMPKSGKRQPSYAEMATGTVTASSRDLPPPESDLGDDSVIISPANEPDERRDSEPPVTLKGSPRSPAKQSPRFAQPTESFARRADETVRKDSVSGMSPDGSPTKSFHTKSFRTMSQRQRKRKSIPGGWMTEAGTASPSKGSPKEDKAIAAAGTMGTSPEKTIRKKESSYMSPTKATTQRTIATLGEETSKRVSPKIQRSPARINTCLPFAKGPDTAGSEAITSASSIFSCDSDIIITDRPIVQATTDPFVQGQSDGSTADPAKREAFVSTTQDRRRSSFNLPRRLTVGDGCCAVEEIAARARAAGLLPIPNTIRQRRGSSFGDYLGPILLKLDAKGVKRPESLMSIDPYSPVMRSEDPPKAAPNQQVARDLPVGLPNASQTTPTPSLRATAQEFRPMLQVQTFGDQSPPVDPYTTIGDQPMEMPVELSPELAFRPKRQWDRMPLMQRQWTRALGQQTVPRPMNPVLPVLDPYCSTDSTPVQHAQPYAGSFGVHGDLFSSLYSVTLADQTRMPESNPTTRALHRVDDTGSKISPVSFGRAAPPPPPPTPDEIRTPASWAIGSSLNSPGVYAWSGGDGREIKFVGWGPDAERDPGTPVNFAFHPRKTNTERGPRMIGDEDDTNSPPLAPRSREQWAQKMGYPKIPCSTMEVIDAYEILPNPFEHQEASYCFDRPCYENFATQF